MKLQTKIPLTAQENQIDYNSKVLLLGSCFVENIGEKLAYYKFQTLQNPFGILFQPSAIEHLVSRAINEDPFTEEDIFFYNEQWHCFEVHSSLSNQNKDEFLKTLNKKRIQLLDFLKSASHIVFTYGTSWVYKNIETNSSVANCHKVPQKKFAKELLSVGELTKVIDHTVSLIRSINNEASIVFSVSPVRHVKDGIIENTRSKAHLISAIYNSINERRTKKNTEVYFPSFEIMMDELRDYRFYKEDMIHPNKTAISIIWEAFNEVWIAAETKQLQKEIGVIQSGLQHKPFYPESKAHQDFMEALNKKKKALQKKKPRIKF